MSEHPAHPPRSRHGAGRRLLRRAGLAPVLALLAALAPAAAQDRFDEVPDLVDRGQVDGWRLGKLDSSNVWLGRACVLYKPLEAGPNPISVTYRFEPGENEATVSFDVPTAEPVADPDEVDWGYLEPADFIYAVSETQAYEADGYIGWEYIDPQTVYVSLSFDLDAAEVDRIAASDWVGVAVMGSESGMRFDTGRAAPAVAWARQCLAEFE